MPGSLEVLHPPVGIASAANRAPVESGGRWSLVSRILFRFTVLYFGFYVFFTQMMGTLLLLPVIDFPEIGAMSPMRNLVAWAAAHVFGLTTELVVTGSGSGDKTFDWIEAWCLLMLALAGTVIWSVADRTRPHYQTLNKWFRLFLRFALGSTMVNYGAIKVIPAQMPVPSLIRLVEPFGDFSPMGVLWSSIGAMPAYERFAGSVEMAAGLLLFVPALTTLGALVSLAAATQIFVLNMTYDVPVKLFSFHLILMSLVLLAPDASRLAHVFVLNRAVTPSQEPPLVRGWRAGRLLLAGQLVFGAYLAGMSLWNSSTEWAAWGTGSPKSPLYGIWEVDEMSIDGQLRPPLVTDAERWGRVVFDSPTYVAFQGMRGKLEFYDSAFDASTRMLTLTKGDDKPPKARLAVQQPQPTRLVLEGDLDGHKVHVVLRRTDQTKFMLLSRGFHWVQEYPFNR